MTTMNTLEKDWHYIGLDNKTPDENTSSVDEILNKEEKFKEYTLKWLNWQGVSGLVDMIIERAWTTNSSSELDAVIEESRQISLNHWNYENVQNLIASIRKKLNIIRTEEWAKTPKMAVAIRAEKRRKFKWYR